ncbi:MAG: shikimate dehydrogenase [Chloroflexi bacterium]|nr:shikimate dehydrogenase [Chloroflexota bacterium]
MTHRWAWLIGQPVAHSLSPALHNAAFAAAGLDAQYSVRETSAEELPAVIDALRAPDCLGANVTAPHKRTAVDLLDDLSDAARAIGAANTIVKRGADLLGDNTDARGLERWMRVGGVDVRGRTALVLGGGGAARASVWALAQSGASCIEVLNRTETHVHELIEVLQPRVPGAVLRAGPLHDAAAPHDDAYAVVVNATSLGHHGGAPVVHPSCYSRESVALELVYNPPLTGFMRAAQEAGAGRVENGLGMLVQQAALAFECWTSQPAPLDAYERVGREAVRR